MIARFYLNFAFFLLTTCLPAQSGPLEVLLAPRNVSCAGLEDGRLVLTLLNGALPTQYQWTSTPGGLAGGGAFTPSMPQVALEGLPAGNYRFTITDAVGDTVYQQSFISEPDSLELNLLSLSQFNGFDVACANLPNGRMLATPKGGTLPYFFSWSHGAAGPSVDSLAGGNYEVTVTDARGCTLTASRTLTVPPPIVPVIEVRGEKCLDERSGRVEILSITGGIPPYLTEFDHQDPDTQRLWTHLEAGQYFLTIIDANGCRQREAAILPTGLSFTFDLGPDTASIYTGDTLVVPLILDEPLLSATFTPAGAVSWSPGEPVRFFPGLSTAFSATLVDTNGCVAKDYLRISVNRLRSVFLPNVLAPNDNNPANRAFTVFGGGGIRQVESLSVYNRLGKKVFENRGFQPNSPVQGWNGMLSTTELAPNGVYAYVAVVRYTDNRLETFYGDVTVVR